LQIACLALSSHDALDLKGLMNWQSRKNAEIFVGSPALDTFVQAR